MRPPPEQLVPIIREAAREHILPRFMRVGHDVKADGSLLTEADLATQAALEETLKAHWPDIAFLGEEMEAAQQARLLEAGGPLWCLDPLDGTSNFAAGLPLFAVSLALIEAGAPTVAVTYDPLRDECFTATADGPAALNGKPLQATPRRAELSRCTALVDFKRLPKALTGRLAAEPPYSSQRNFGSCALEWCWIAAGRGHLYLHGGMKLWDHAAGTLILNRAGGSCCTLDGEPVFKPTLAPRSVIAARDAGLFAAWRAHLLAQG
ncbi:MAG: inositol monophosphatase family protein [Gammaproteobacteria bacterium]